MSHAIERARERYGVELTQDDLHWVHQQLVAKSQYVYFMSPQRHGGKFWAVWLKDQWLAFMVAADGSIMTCLPKKLITSRRKKLDARARTFATTI